MENVHCIDHMTGIGKRGTKSKGIKVGSWYLRGGYESVLFVHSTPHSILQKRYQSKVDRQSLWIRVVENAGRSVKSMVQRSDQERCGRESRPMCTTGGKGSCGKKGITYSITCNNCAERTIVRVYHGETSKNAYTHEKMHSEDLDRKIDASVMW